MLVTASGSRAKTTTTMRRVAANASRYQWRCGFGGAACGTAFSSSSDDTAESEVAHPNADVLPLTRRRAVADVRARGPQGRAAYADLAPDAERGVVRVDACLALAATSILRRAIGRCESTPPPRCPLRILRHIG